MKAREGTPHYALPLAAVSIADVPKVGGKNASLGEMIRELSPLGVRWRPHRARSHLRPRE